MSPLWVVRNRKSSARQLAVRRRAAHWLGEAEIARPTRCCVRWRRGSPRSDWPAYCDAELGCRAAVTGAGQRIDKTYYLFQFKFIAKNMQIGLINFERVNVIIVLAQIFKWSLKFGRSPGGGAEQIFHRSNWSASVVRPTLSCGCVIAPAGQRKGGRVVAARDLSARPCLDGAT